MKTWLQPIAETCAGIVELIGIVMLTALAIYTISVAIVLLLRGVNQHEVWQQTRQKLGRSILLGLEFLVTADIIHTVAVELTYETVFVLGLIVLIRTFLSFSIDFELSGKGLTPSGSHVETG